MSSEGKSKRGNSGKKNAESQPFRLSGGGVHPDHLRRIATVAARLCRAHGQAACRFGLGQVTVAMRPMAH